MAEGGGPPAPPPGKPGGSGFDPASTGLGAPGFGWGTDPKTGAYRYGRLGANGFLVPGTGEIPPVDEAGTHTTGNIPVAKSSGRGVGIGAVIAGVLLVVVIVAGIAITSVISRVGNSISTVFQGTCVGAPMPNRHSIDLGDGTIRVRCSGGGTIIMPGIGGPTVSATPVKHHHHHNNGG